jgi:hypothetical protein
MVAVTTPVELMNCICASMSYLTPPSVCSDGVWKWMSLRLYSTPSVARYLYLAAVSQLRPHAIRSVRDCVKHPSEAPTLTLNTTPTGRGRGPLTC